LLGALLARDPPRARVARAAANKEHQQLMADLRMLQEQSQLLQNLIGSVTEAIKAVNTRLDQQAETTRKAFADQKLVIDNLTNDVRVIREKLDDNNVRIGSLTQEVDSLRQSMQQCGRVRRQQRRDRRRRSPPAGGRRRPAAAAPSVPSPQKLFDSASATTTPAVRSRHLGFSDYIKSFPKSDRPTTRRSTSARRTCRTASTTRRSRPATSRSAPTRTATDSRRLLPQGARAAEPARSQRRRATRGSTSSRLSRQRRRTPRQAGPRTGQASELK
jgi:prefoldin subunit 5